jgi:prepilin-type N-terminal cleavage/methylation domain-containing protein
MTTAKSGFTVVELILTLVLVGIITATAGMFLLSGVNNYFDTMVNSDTAMKAQVALNRISLELKEINALPTVGAYTPDVSLAYSSANKSQLPGNRRLRFANGKLFIDVEDAAYMLLDNVTNATLRVNTADMDGNPGNEIQGIEVSFACNDVPTPFSITVFPRHLVPGP